MKTVLLICVSYFALCAGSDNRCTSTGGICEDDQNSCSGHYVSGLCDGAATRRCCVSADHGCIAIQGHCQEDTVSCSGSYHSGLCDGHASRRCCAAHASSDCDGVEIVSRASWNAQNPSSISHLSSPVPNFFIHHTETPSCHDIESCSSRVRSIQSYHMNSRHWSDIGYSFLVGEDGRVYEGRGWTRVGAHTYGHNSDALAASMIGSFDSHMPNDAALNAVKTLIQCGVSKGYIQPNFSLFGHRDVNPTSCPGDSLYNHLSSLWPTHFHRTTAKYYSQGK